MVVEAKSLMKKAFCPPKYNPGVAFFATLLCPVLLTLKSGLVSVKLTPGSRRRLWALKNAHAILTPNHTTLYEPGILWWVSRWVPGRYFFVSSRELFDMWNGFLGWILQRVGTYSIQRGTVDHDSIQTTLTLLTQGPHKIVIFPEGHTYHQNDTLLPFLEGTFFMAFRAQERLEKALPGEAILIVPVAIKYRFRFNSRVRIIRGLSALESALGLPAGNDTSTEGLYQRLRTAGITILSRIEEEFARTPEAKESINERIGILKEIILKQLEARLGFVEKKETTVLARLRKVIFSAAPLLFPRDPGVDHHPASLLTEDEKKVLIKNTLRLLNFIALYDGYVRENLCQERFLDTLHRLEREVFGDFRTEVWKTAYVNVGNPIRLLDHYENYKQRKMETVQQVTALAEAEVARLLKEMEHFCTPL